MVIDKAFWRNKTVLITGHTGFKGSWLVMRLNHLGANIIGYSNLPPTNPNLFELAKIKEKCKASIIGDICDVECLNKTFKKHQPDIVFHMAAQALVKVSYENPIKTYQTNVMGTLYVLEAAKNTESTKTLVVITSDKCYQNQKWLWGYRENEPMGGNDPYSSSKGCAELLTASYRTSFCNNKPNIATARAGNVIGGGDWAKDRLIPDIVKAITNNCEVSIRNPKSIRPWQHVIEPLQGYLMLAEKLYQETGERYAQAWNFGPDFEDAQSVEWLVKTFSNLWGDEFKWKTTANQSSIFHEETYLKLDCSKAKSHLNWQPIWKLPIAIEKTVEWYKGFLEGKNVRNICEAQIKQYETELLRNQQKKE